MTLARFTKQPSEILDYLVDYTEWFSERSDTPSTEVTTVDAGITKVSSGIDGRIVKVVLSGGTVGESYKITTRLTTTSGIVREADFTVAVKEL
jgi:hypothetical protein